MQKKLIAEMWYYQQRDYSEKGYNVKTKDKELMKKIRTAYNLDKIPKSNVFWIACGKLVVIRWILEDRKRYNPKKLAVLEDEYEGKFWYLTWYEKNCTDHLQTRREMNSKNPHLK